MGELERYRLESPEVFCPFTHLMFDIGKIQIVGGKISGAPWISPSLRGLCVFYVARNFYGSQISHLSTKSFQGMCLKRNKWVEAELCLFNLAL